MNFKKIADTSFKEEKKLMTKFIIASRNREDVDLPYYFATC